MAFPSIHIRGPGGGHIRPSPEILAIVEKQKSDGSKLHSKVVEERLTALHGSSDALDPDDENVVHSITTMARFFHSRVNNARRLYREGKREKCKDLLMGLLIDITKIPAMVRVHLYHTVVACIQESYEATQALDQATTLCATMKSMGYQLDKKRASTSGIMHVGDAELMRVRIEAIRAVLKEAIWDPTNNNELRERIGTGEVRLAVVEGN